MTEAPAETRKQQELQRKIAGMEEENRALSSEIQKAEKRLDRLTLEKRVLLEKLAELSNKETASN